MNKTFFTILLLFAGLYSTTAEAAKEKKKSVPQNWIEAVVEAKMSITQELKKAQMPIQVLTPRGTRSTVTFTADVRNLSQLFLTAGDADYFRQDDNAIWINPRLTTVDGQVYDMADVKHDVSVVGPGEVNFSTRRRSNAPNTLGDNAPIKVMSLRGYSLIQINLNKKYTKFEAEVMTESGYRGGALTYTLTNTYGKSQVDKLHADFPSKVSLLSTFTSFYNVLLNDNTKGEAQAAEAIVKLLKNPVYYQSQLNSAKNIVSVAEQAKAYLTIFDAAFQTYTLQEGIQWINIKAIGDFLADMKKSREFNKKYDFTTNESKFAELKSLTQKGFDGIYTNNPEAIASANKALKLKKEILLANPVLDVDKFIVGRFNIGPNARQVSSHAIGTQPNNWSNQTSSAQEGFDAAIMEMSNLRGDIQFRPIFKPTNTSSVADLKLHWDADRILFSMVEPDDHHWQVFEVGVDGNHFKQVTKGGEEDLDFFDATYLPSGKIIAASNVGGQGVPCVNGSDQVGNFCVIDPENNTMRRLTFDQDANWHPTVMHNGRIMYVRWEYTDLTHYFSRIVMHMNPDGTEQRALYGSGSVFPNSTFDIQPLPNHPTQFVGVISGHHGVCRAGRLMIFDPAKSRKEEKGMVQEIPYRNRPIIPLVKDELVNDVWPQFIKPIPLNNDYFIVTAKLSPEGLWGLYLVDVWDNLTLIAEYEGEGLIYGIPVRKTKTPPVIPDKVNLNSKEATVFIQDIYEGEGLPNVPRGTVKELRVFAYEYAYLRSPSDHVAQGIQSGWDIKRLLGTVPVEEDGSAMFKIPANTPISLQPLDDKGRAIQWMRSWLTGQPGETVSCVGCHEDQSQIPMPKRVIASTRPPRMLTQPEGGVRSFTFDLEIQPILDRNCISCHNANSKIDLTGGRKDSATGFNKSYLAFHPYFHRQGPEAGMKVLYPYEYHASNSTMVRMLEVGHYGVNLTEKEWRTLYNWIDFNVPDKGYFVALEYHGGDQKSRRIEMNKKYANGIYVDWEKEIRDYAEYLSSQPKPESVKPDFKEPQFKEVKLKGFPFNAKEFIASSLKIQERKVVEIAPGVSLTFVRIPAGQFVMGKNKKNSNYAPAFKANVQKAFWMSEKEITNEQMRALVPSHDSRFIDQQWKDHVNEGYPANLPEQPASRVSWFDAEDFCNKLSAQTGQKVMLPTETQWEWACRAGSADDFWYGNINTDFGHFENFADKQTNKMAVIGVDPQPMDPSSFWYKYYTFLPKIESVDDGHMIVANPGSYQANPFGLYDMHGNLAEWTRSDYLPYPLSDKNKATSEYKVVRGGSWKEHPKHATASYRKYFLPIQKPYNVGFRVVIED